MLTWIPAGGVDASKSGKIVLFSLSSALFVIAILKVSSEEVATNIMVKN